MADKTSRRDHIAKRHRVLLLIGDSLNDFVSAGNKPSPARRREVAAENASMWGEKWILIPNANYCGWERALYEFEHSLSRKEKLAAKYRCLDTSGRAEE